MGQALSCLLGNEAVQTLRHQVEIGDCHAIMECIWENPAFLNAPCFPGKNTLLHVVARYGQTSMLVAILQFRDELACIPASSGNIPACNGDNSDSAAESVVQAHPKTVLVNAVNARQQTPLIIAASRGHADIVHILINEGANIHVADKAEGCTALHYAAMYGRVECVKVLLFAAGSQPYGSSTSSSSLAYDNGSMPASQDRSTAGAVRGTSHVADTRQHDFINCVSYAGATPLHFASDAGAADVVRLLCAHGANVNAVLKPIRLRWLALHKGSTPLHLAAEQGHLAVVLAILKHKYEHDDVQDPRDVLDGASLRPHQLAFLSHHYRLALILRPGYPLNWLFEPPVPVNDKVKVPRLAVIAAQALRQQLCTVLDQLETQLVLSITAAGNARQVSDANNQTSAENLADATQRITLTNNGRDSSRNCELSETFIRPFASDAHAAVSCPAVRQRQPVQLGSRLASLHTGLSMGPATANELTQQLDLHLNSSHCSAGCSMSHNSLVANHLHAESPDNGKDLEPDVLASAAHPLQAKKTAEGSIRQADELNLNAKSINCESMSGPPSLSLIGVPHKVAVHHNMMPLQPASESAECPVCYEDIDMSQLLTCQPCKHHLCVPCARRVCTAIKAKPAACPMCRANIHGFDISHSIGLQYAASNIA